MSEGAPQREPEHDGDEAGQPDGAGLAGRGREHAVAQEQAAAESGDGDGTLLPRHVEPPAPAGARSGEQAVRVLTRGAERFPRVLPRLGGVAVDLRQSIGDPRAWHVPQPHRKKQLLAVGVDVGGHLLAVLVGSRPDARSVKVVQSRERAVRADRPASVTAKTFRPGPP